jgi:hypothetical protein
MSTTSFLIPGQIGAGDHDEHLDAIISACMLRQRAIGGTKIFTLKIGDTVVFNERARPGYLQGEKATIKKINRARVVIDLHRPVGRFGQRGLRCPVDIIDKVP